MKIKRIMRLFALALMIALACVLPVPMSIYKKDDLPKNLIERIEQDEDKEDEKERAIY
jgi:hypothetical protein